MFKYFLYRLALFITDRLPLNSSYKFAVMISDFQWLCSIRDRQAVKKNLLAISSSREDISARSREVFRNFGRYLVEFFQVNQKVDREFIRKHVRVTGQKHIDEVLQKGKGGIVITAHIGNWEMGATLLSVLGYPVYAVALPHKERPVNELFNNRRAMKGVNVIPTNMSLRHCIQLLKNNKLVALVADRDFSQNGLVMDFLGHKTMIPKGAAQFSLRTGAPIIPVFLLRDRDGRFEMKCYEPVYPPPATNGNKHEAKTIMKVIRGYLPVIEEQIRAHPQQWLLFREFSCQ